MKICSIVIASLGLGCFTTVVGQSQDAPFAAFKTDVGNSSNQVVNIVALGDSETSGNGASVPANSWLNKLTAQLQAEFGNGGTGLIPLYDNVAQEAVIGSKTMYKWVLSGPGWRGGAPDIGPNSPNQHYQKYSLYYGAANHADVTATLPNIPNVDAFCIYYVTYRDTGQGITYSIDGGGQALLPGSNHITSRLIPAKSCVKAGGVGTHTLTLSAPAAGEMFLFGAEGTHGTTGVRVHNLAYAGSDAYFVGHDTESQLAPLIGLIGNISLVINAYGGENDWQQSPEYNRVTYATYLQNSISFFQQLYPLPSILLIGETNDEHGAYDMNGFGTQAVYQDAQEEVWYANPSVAFFSFANLLGSWATANAHGYMYDHVHPNDAGQALIANRLYFFIF